MVLRSRVTWSLAVLDPRRGIGALGAYVRTPSGACSGFARSSKAGPKIRRLLQPFTASGRVEDVSQATSGSLRAFTWWGRCQLSTSRLSAVAYDCPMWRFIWHSSSQIRLTCSARLGRVEPGPMSRPCLPSLLIRSFPPSVLQVCRIIPPSKRGCHLVIRHALRPRPRHGPGQVIFVSTYGNTSGHNR